MKDTISRMLRRLAQRIDGRLFVEITPSKPNDGDSDVEFAERQIGLMQLREALRRYSPREQPGQA
jgi:hypothetical protein